MSALQTLDDTTVQYRRLFDGTEGALKQNGVDWVLKLRTAGFARFAELGFPTPDQEAWRYTSFRSLENTNFRSLAGAGLDPGTGAVGNPLMGMGTETSAHAADLSGHFLPDTYRMVFVDGRYLPTASDLPPDGLIQTLEQSLHEHRTLLEPPLARTTDNAFVALNQAFLGEGMLLRLSRGQSLGKPLHLLFVSTRHDQPYITHPRMVCLLGENSQATVVETYVGDGVYFTNPVWTVSLEAGAMLNYCKVQTESVDAFHVGAVQVEQGRSSTFFSTVLSLGGRLVRQDINVALRGEGATCTLNGLSLVAGQQHVDHATGIDHVVPHCSSHELYKTMLDDKATAGFTGRILVLQDAQKTDAHQSNKSLLLSPDATVSTRPQLQIYADDVKCTHGAAVGQLDDHALFYLRSRGIDHDQARNLLTYAFGSEVVEALPLMAVRQALQTTLRQRLGLGDVVSC